MRLQLVLRPLPYYLPRPYVATNILSNNTFSTGAVTITGDNNVVGSQAGNTVSW
ncbi:MAG TPA: hypothetical protein VFO85_19205 [Vicinamibacteria bacterium]|nr:hypothetical protein [Vicinamibacteria bacterium]